MSTKFDHTIPCCKCGAIVGSWFLAAWEENGPFENWYCQPCGLKIPMLESPSEEAIEAIRKELDLESAARAVPV